MRFFLQRTTILPSLAWVLYFSGLVNSSGFFQMIACVFMIMSVISAVHHTEIIGLKVGEPYGTIILAVAITVIEVSIIISLMLSGGEGAASLARDTVYASTMLILNGIIGFSLFIGGLKHYVQTFSKHSAIIALVSLVSILILTMVFPTYTTSVHGPYYSKPQLIFASVACLTIYSFFLIAQTTRHREYFLQSGDNKPKINADITNWMLAASLLFLFISLGIVVILAKTLSPAIENIVIGKNLPKALVGIIIAAVILLPEGISAIKAARNNKLQTSLNLALGSVLASIGLTIPCVALFCSIFNIEIILGLDIKSIILLGLSVFTVMLSLSSGRTNIVYGAVLLVNLFAYVFLIIYP